MDNNIWMMSNRQPWVHAILEGWINAKTRSWAVNLPPVGATVYLHASQALWKDWRGLWWVRDYHVDVPMLPHGGVCGVAKVKAVGVTDDLLVDKLFWDVRIGFSEWNCADEQTIVFEDIKRIPFIPCRGALVPTRKLPQELLERIENGWE